MQASATPERGDLHRKLKSRHLSMIAIGGSIGTGLFVASGATIAQAGPGGALVAKAEGIAQPAGDKAAFLALLHQAEEIKDAPGSPRALANEVMRRRARWLIDNADDLF